MEKNLKQLMDSMRENFESFINAAQEIIDAAQEEKQEQVKAIVAETILAEDNLNLFSDMAEEKTLREKTKLSVLSYRMRKKTDLVRVAHLSSRMGVLSRYVLKDCKDAGVSVVRMPRGNYKAIKREDIPFLLQYMRRKHGDIYEEVNA